MVDNGDGTKTGPQISVGDELEYTIDFKNSYDKPATVTIVDPLDDGVDFVGAALNAGTTTPGGEGFIAFKDADDNIITTGEDAWNVSDTDKGKVYSYTYTYPTSSDGQAKPYDSATISYNADTHTVTYVFNNYAANTAGKVLLKVMVNKNAQKTWTYDPSKD